MRGLTAFSFSRISRRKPQPPPLPWMRMLPSLALWIGRVKSKRKPSTWYSRAR
jgi:hypothetical protein